MSDNSGRPGRPGRPASIEELLDQAVAAQHRGGPGTATTQPCRELAVVSDNEDITDVLGVPTADGEIRRLTMLFADLVDSTVLSTRVEPETYHLVVRRYREQVLAIVNRFEGHVCFTKGDGLLAVFGHPRAHDNDVQRAVAAGLDITREVRRLSAEAKRRFGIEISVRVGVHRGMVYLDTTQDDVYGLAANLTARVAGLAPRGSVVVSDAIEPLLRDAFHVQQRPPAAVKGFDGMVAHHVVVGERSEPAAVTRGPLIGRDREVQQLRTRWAHAQAGTLTTPAVLFRGEPGIGKSRLAAAAADSVERCGAVTLELIGSPFRTQVGLHPIRTLLRRRCGIERGTDPGQCLALLEAEGRPRVGSAVGCSVVGPRGRGARGRRLRIGGG